ncbi:MAG: cytochrome P450 [Limnothrix sp. RL_2_0]|nr:cytochrome P450 [Limnothrix sp. RL_2_0]
MTVTAVSPKSIPSLSQSSFQQKLRLILEPTSYFEDLLGCGSDMVMMPSAGYEKPVVTVYNPEALKQILVNDQRLFSSPGILNKLLAPLTGTRSLASLDGDRHKRERKLMMPSFHGERMYNYGNLIQGIIRDELLKLTVGQVFIAQEMTQRITLRTIIEVVFGIKKGDRYEPIIELTQGILNRFSSPLATSFLFFDSLQKDFGPWSPWGSFIRARQKLDDLIYAEIGDRRAHPDPDRTDILSLLINARDEAGEAMTDSELRDEMMLLLFAGHETTAIALAWSLYWMHADPSILAKLRSELADANSSNPMDIFRLPYVSAVGNETLRINPVAMFTFARQAEADTELLGYKIVAKDILFGCIYALHQRPDLYPNPRQFRPERFLERQYTPYEFMPFGGGTRRCLGEALAQFELRLGIDAFATVADFELLDDIPLAAKRKGVVLSPKTGVKMRLLGIKN